VNRSASASLSQLTFPMNDILNQSTVLVLNRHWQAIHVKTPAEAFCMIATGAATALDVRGRRLHHARPLGRLAETARPRA
jgi:hypothetical protein